MAPPGRGCCSPKGCCSTALAPTTAEQTDDEEITPIVVTQSQSPSITMRDKSSAPHGHDQKGLPTSIDTKSACHTEHSHTANEEKPPCANGSTCCTPQEKTAPCCEVPVESQQNAMATHSSSHHHHHEPSEDVSRCCTPHAERPYDCCSGTQTHDTHACTHSETSTTIDADVEKGPSTYDRIVLSIGGLKCGCCETGIAKAIRHIPAIGAFQINLVLSRVEFDLDTGRLSVAQVISRLDKATGFTFTEFERTEGHSLEVLVGDAAKFCALSKPFGVISVDLGAKRLRGPSALFKGRLGAIFRKSPPTLHPSTGDSRGDNGLGQALYLQSIRIQYDSAQIGARDILEYYQRHAPEQNIQLAPPSPHPSFAAARQQVKDACIMFTITALFTIPVLVLEWAPIHEKKIHHHVSLALATVVQIVATREFVPGALRSLIHSGVFEMDFLIALSSTTAYVFSVVAYVLQLKGHPLQTGSFFETSTLLVTLILLGRVVTEFARVRATKAVSFRSLQADEALLVVAGAQTRKIDARLLQFGDRFKVPPHTRIVTDGKVIYGGSEVDESMVTGESMPVAKGLGNEVFAGSVNGSGELVVTLTALPHDNSISRIAELVENAELSKPKVQALADKIAGWFVPAIVTIGTIVFFVWMFVGRYRLHRSWGHAVTEALTYGIATLIVSCPCAIGLAVPMVVLIAGGVSARYGIILRDGQKIEVARNATDVVFDKTGTVTAGELILMATDYHGNEPTQIKKLILGLLGDNKHPVSAAVVKQLRSELGPDVNVPKFVNVRSVPGSGVEGTCNDSKLDVRAGNPEWLGVEVLQSPHTILCVTVSGVLSATFRLQDRIHANAKSIISLLTARGINVHMISGDNECTVRDVAHLVGIPRKQTRSRCTPASKQTYVQELQQKGKVVIFCGDGTNDSVALKQADVGVHMSHGSDVAQGASDVVFMTSSLHCVLILLDISRAAYRRIIFNFTWSAVYNSVAILFAAGAFVRVRLEPAYAGLGELASVLPVVFIAFALKWKDFAKRYKDIKME